MILTELKQLLEAKGIHPLKRFGQNFLYDPNQQRWIVDRAGELCGGGLRGARVLEIGPGPGCLTEHLLDAGAEVVAVEIDRGLAAICRERLGARPGLRLIEADALQSKHALSDEVVAALIAPPEISSPPATPLENPVGGAPLLLVANLPYQIAVPVILLLWTHPALRLSGMVVTVQKEVGERLMVQPSGASGKAGNTGKIDSKAYGPPAAILASITTVERLKLLAPHCFWPAPQVDSAIIRIRPLPDAQLSPALQCPWPERAARLQAWSQFLQELFQQRRKTLRKALQSVKNLPDLDWSRLPFDPQQRAEQLAPMDLLQLWLAVGPQPGPAVD